MKPQATFHEILLFTGTGFSNRPFCRKESDNNIKTFPGQDELERACWDGLLHELFPELIGSFSAKCESFIWHVMHGKNFLAILIGPVPLVTENETTIDPYFYTSTMNEN